jgi:hypothetical protein
MRGTGMTFCHGCSKYELLEHAPLFDRVYAAAEPVHAAR